MDSGASANVFYHILHLLNHRFNTLHILHIGNPFHCRRHADGHEGDEENHQQHIGSQGNQERFPGRKR